MLNFFCSGPEVGLMFLAEQFTQHQLNIIILFSELRSGWLRKC